MEMTDRVEITVAVISGAVGTTDGALSLTNSDPSSLTIVSTTGQIIANVAGISPIGAYVTAPGAALVTLYKATVDVQEQHKVEVGDLLNIAGNGLSFAGGALAVAGVGAAITLPLAAGGIAVAVLGMVANQNAWVVNDVGTAWHGSTASIYGNVSPTTNTTFLSSQTASPLRVDPLILDLDNDGLETLGINSNDPILFDHNGNGVKTGTGWVKSDDAFLVLVLDRNGNGSIDNGRELFGDSTPLSAGGVAADGFAALAQEDTNGDGKVDSLDARFANLRLWRDFNQDGISQAGELFTLASQNIIALNLAKTANSQLLANGNQIADLGGYVRSDGRTGTLGEVTAHLGDIKLASNPFYSRLTDLIALTEQARSLPTAAGSALATQLAAYAAETTRSGQLARLDDLLKAWADTSSMATTATGAFAGVKLTVNFAGVSSGSSAWHAWLDKLSILERFNGQTFLPVPATGTTLGIDFFNTRETLLDASYAALKASVYGGLLLQTRLKPYLEDIGLTVDENGVQVDFSAMESRLDAAYQADSPNAFIDRLELIKHAGQSLEPMGWHGEQKLATWISDAEASGTWATTRAAIGAEFTTTPVAGDEIELCTSAKDSDVYRRGGGYGVAKAVRKCELIPKLFERTLDACSRGVA